MKTITNVLIMTLSGFISLFTVGKLYGATEAWMTAMIINDYGEGWVTFFLAIWFLMLMTLLFTTCAYVLKRIELFVSIKLASLIS